ncbi:MAG: cupin domain-containing protein [Deltaproteobacteria bacterium]|nr:cupin domain-containing protein [Deltaproteobacteria bacterium]
MTAASIRTQRSHQEFDIDAVELERDPADPHWSQTAGPPAQIPQFSPLRALLHPLDETAFVTRWFRQQVLHRQHHGSNRTHQQILTRDQLLDGIREHRVPTKSVRFLDGVEDAAHDRDVQQYDRSNFTQGTDHERFHFGRIREYLTSRRGTMVVHDLPASFPSVDAFAAGLGEVTGSHTNANAYYTPADCSLYRPHWDTHDVFVVQVHGRKRWRHWDPVLHAPLPGRPYMESTPYVGFHHDLPSHTLELAAGDVLYLPAGVPHTAWTTDEASLHVTFGIMPPLWHQLLSALAGRALAECEKDLDFRRACPAMSLGSTHPAIASQRELLQQRLSKAIAAIDLDEVLAQHFASRPRTFPPVDDQSDAVQLDTMLTRVPGVTVLRERETTVELWSGDECLSFPVAACEALCWLRQHSHLQPHQLPGLADPERLAVARRLVHEGLLRVGPSRVSS